MLVTGSLTAHTGLGEYSSACMGWSQTGGAPRCCVYADAGGGVRCSGELLWGAGK